MTTDQSNSPITTAFRAGSRIRDWSGRRVTVMGIGRFGGGVGVINYLLAEGARVTVTDLGRAEELQASLDQIDLSKLAALQLEGHRPQDFIEADTVIVNPAVKRDHPLLLQAAIAGVALTSEITIFWNLNPARVVAITGSVGKSTTTALIHHLLKESGRTAWMGGNIGRSLLHEVPHMTSDDWVVLELSSFQLWDLDHVQPAADVAVVTNYFPHHLSWHGSAAEYRRCKQVLFRSQLPHQLRVYNADDPDISAWPGLAQPITCTAGKTGQADVVSCEEGLRVRQGGTETVIPRSSWAHVLPGSDQDRNVAQAVATAVLGCGLRTCDVSHWISSFQPLPHRREFVAERHAVRFINDSKATTVQATLAACAALTPPVGKRLLLLIGGTAPLAAGERLLESVDPQRVRLFCFGMAGEHLAATATQLSRGALIHSISRSLMDAFQQALRDSRPGDTVLLSPGCPGYGDFLNYEQRGEYFRALVLERPPAAFSDSDF